MSSEPDLSFDVDALFKHMVDNLGHELDQELNWSFDLQSSDVGKLERIAELLGDEFCVHVQEDVQEHHEDGTVTAADPLLLVHQRAALSPAQVKQIAARMTAIAEEHGVTYTGVSCDDFDEDAFMAWMDLDEAVWRLRYYIDNGVYAPDEPMPWTFLFVAHDVAALQQTAESLDDAHVDRIVIYEEADEDGDYGMVLYSHGSNSESALVERHALLAGHAEQQGAELAGIQFFVDEDDDDEDEEENFN